MSKRILCILLPLVLTLSGCASPQPESLPTLMDGVFASLPQESHLYPDQKALENALMDIYFYEHHRWTAQFYEAREIDIPYFLPLAPRTITLSKRIADGFRAPVGVIGGDEDPGRTEYAARYQLAKPSEIYGTYDVGYALKEYTKYDRLDLWAGYIVTGSSQNPVRHQVTIMKTDYLREDDMEDYKLSLFSTCDIDVEAYDFTGEPTRLQQAVFDEIAQFAHARMLEVPFAAGKYTIMVDMRAFQADVFRRDEYISILVIDEMGRRWWALAEFALLEDGKTYMLTGLRDTNAYDDSDREYMYDGFCCVQTSRYHDDCSAFGYNDPYSLSMEIVLN